MCDSLHAAACCKAVGTCYLSIAAGASQHPTVLGSLNLREHLQQVNPSQAAVGLLATQRCVIIPDQQPLVMKCHPQHLISSLHQANGRMRLERYLPWTGWSTAGGERKRPGRTAARHRSSHSCCPGSHPAQTAPVPLAASDGNTPQAIVLRRACTPAESAAARI